MSAQLEQGELPARRGERRAVQRLGRAAERLASVFTAGICALLAWHGGRLVWFEYQDGTTLGAGIPAWVAQIVIPLGFGLMALRFALLALTPAASRPLASEESPS